MLLTGDKGIPTSSYNQHGALILGSTICVGVILAVLLPGAGRKAQTLAAILVTYALVTFVVPVWYSGLADSSLRYSVIPVMMLVGAIALLIAPAGPEGSRTTAAVSRPLFVVYELALILTGFSVTNARSPGQRASHTPIRPTVSELVPTSRSKCPLRRWFLISFRMNFLWFCLATTLHKVKMAGLDRYESDAERPGGSRESKASPSRRHE